MARSTRDVSVELFVRSLSPSDGPVARNVYRLRALESRDRIERGRVVVWGREIDLSQTVRTSAPGRFFLDRVATFRSWAADRDVTIEPFFGTREVHCSITGEEYATLTLPVCCLAEYHDGSLQHVVPHSDGRVSCGVEDRLATLAEGDAPGFEADGEIART